MSPGSTEAGGIVLLMLQVAASVGRIARRMGIRIEVFVVVVVVIVDERVIEGAVEGGKRGNVFGEGGGATARKFGQW